MQDQPPEIIPADDRDVYRSNISNKNKYSWIIRYKYSDIFLSCDRDIRDRVLEPLESFYKDVEALIEKDQSFATSLSPITPESHYPETVKHMCKASEAYNVGPMATIAGAVCEFLAQALIDKCNKLIIENGGDTLVIGEKNTTIGIHAENNYFKDKIRIRTLSGQNKFSLCSSSSTFGHSLSLGNCDLAVTLSPDAVYADAAATAIANDIKVPEDIDKKIAKYSKSKHLDGIIIIKDKKIGIWGKLALI